MVILEILPNPNCEAVEQRIFNDLEPPASVAQARVERAGQPVWCSVTGWTLDNTPCPATARKVDDSGEGVVFLIAGGDAGLRLQPADQPSPWSLDDPLQWGEPFLLIADPRDLQFIPDAPPRR